MFQSNDPARLEVDDITVSYNGHPVLHHISFDVPHGARIAVVGPNGAGKSTLFKALVGLLPLREGQIYIHGQPLGNHKDCVAYIPQRGEVDWRFPVTVRDVVMMGRFAQIGWLKRPGKADRQIIQHSLAQMGIADLADRPIGDLSGGQQQRVFLARALAQDPHILLMDEPFTAVDMTTQETTLSLLDHLRERQVTAIISTHDLNLAASRFDAILLLNRHLIAYGKPEEVLQQEHLARAFGPQLMVLPDGTLFVDQCCPPDEELETHRHDHAEAA